MMAPNIWIIRKDGTTVRQIEARPGLKTYSGVITRVSDKSIWTQRPGGNERLWRTYDGQLPAIYQSYAPAK
jgi:hypothetical protein